VLEINPRLTTSYCVACGPALGLNPAALVLGLLQAADPSVHLAGSRPGATAEIRLEPSLAG
jgi:hypothetical protein